MIASSISYVYQIPVLNAMSAQVIFQPKIISTITIRNTTQTVKFHVRYVIWNSLISTKWIDI